MVSDLEQMENIVTQFLAYARRNKSEQVEVDLGEAVKAAMDNARLKSDSTIETEVSLETGHLVMAHPIELSRAIQNLFTNASRYGRSEDGNLRLKVFVRKVGKNAELVVEDQGEGLPEDQRERVMRPFERGESARSGVTGTGLGLAIVDRIVRRSGGSVKLESAEPHGLRVRLTFPASRPKRRRQRRRNLRKRPKSRPDGPSSFVLGKTPSVPSEGVAFQGDSSEAVVPGEENDRLRDHPSSRPTASIFSFVFALMLTASTETSKSFATFSRIVAL